jgi:hypothetical protein
MLTDTDKMLLDHMTMQDIAKVIAELETKLSTYGAYNADQELLKNYRDVLRYYMIRGVFQE